MSNYYDATKLLSLMDRNGDRPEIYMCTTNRSAGKTTWFSRYLVKKWLEKKEKFGLIYRFKNEVTDVPDKFFKDIGGLFFKGHTMTQQICCGGAFIELLLDDEPCGYAMALNTADTLKKYSHMFSDISRLFMDEFQSETNHYCSDEVRKFISLHTTIARGQGQAVRYVPVYMCSNAVTLLNPYYSALGVASEVQANTRFVRGEGYVLETGIVEAAAEAQKNSPFNRAFANNKYVAYSSQNIYLNDNSAFIEKPKTAGRYICTLKYGGEDYAIREYGYEGIVYCDTRVDSTFPTKVVVETEDHGVNYVMLKSNDMFLGTLRFYFEQGCFRFKDLKCKEAILKALSY